MRSRAFGFCNSPPAHPTAMNFSFVPYALLPPFTAASAIWWISATPDKPEAYLRLILVWRSFQIVLSHYQNSRSTPVTSSDLRMTIECWLVVSSTIILDVLHPLDPRSVFTSTPKPLIIIDFCTLPLVALLACAVTAASSKRVSSRTQVIQHSGNARNSACASQDIEAQKAIKSCCSTGSVYEPCYDLNDHVEGMEYLQFCDDDEFCTSVTKSLDASDEKAGSRRISIEDTPSTPLQVFIKVEVCREEL